MATNIDTGLTVQDAVNADHSPHVFTMSNGDLVAIYYNGTNLVWRSKSGGSWSAATTITLDTGVTPPQVSYLTRNGDTIFAVASKDPIDASHNGDSFQLTYNTATHTLATTNKSLDAADGNEKAAGIGYISGASANNQVQMLHGNAAGNFCTVQQLNVNPTIVGTDVSPTMGDLRTSANTGVITDGATTTYLIYSYASSGSNRFKVERCVTTSASTTVESPPAPAAAPTGIAGVYDGTNYTFIINEGNAKLRYLTRTGANTYGSWTDILSDASLSGQPAVCVKSNGDLALFYRTNKNQANGEIWSVQRTAGTWGSPSLLAGGAATGWSNPSCAASDLNDTGVARVVYVTGTASTWTLVEDSLTFGGGTTTNTRNVPASAALQSTLTRAVPSSAALQATNTRTVQASAALLATQSRAVLSSAALQSTGNTRTVNASVALLQTSIRNVPSSAALLATASRSVPSSAALQSTITRAVNASGALQATNTRSIAASVLLSGGANVRNVPASAALAALGVTRAIPASAALLQTNSRAVNASATLSLTHARIVPSSAALVAMLTRTTPAAAALQATVTRAIPSSAALTGTFTRTIAASVMLLDASLIVPGDVTLTDARTATASLADALVDRASLADAPLAVVALSDA